MLRRRSPARSTAIAKTKRDDERRGARARQHEERGRPAALLDDNAREQEARRGAAEVAHAVVHARRRGRRAPP